MTETNGIFKIAGEEVLPSKIMQIQIPIARLPTQTLISLPVNVINGSESGAKLWISAAIHGDEINGVEIIRQVVSQVDASKLNGTLVAVPIVNVFGFIDQSRYLPDRRDLNRCFPGSENGSLASRLANLFMREIVNRCTHGIDLHTAAIHRTNLPQIRANLENPETYRCAKAFGSKVMIHSNTRDGSLRQAVSNKGLPILLYEAGEALRFDEDAIDMGVKGIFRVMKQLGMYELSTDNQLPREEESLQVEQSKWVRANRSGIFIIQTKLGEMVTKKQVIGIITDALGNKTIEVKSPLTGIVIGHVQNPLVNQGDALIHVGKTSDM